MLTVALIVCSALIVKYLLSKFSNKTQLPKDILHLPLERGWPIFGILFQIKRSIYEHLTDLSVRLGPIYGVKLGMRTMVVLNNYDWFKKCFKDDADNFSGRPTGKFLKEMTHDAGIIRKDGQTLNVSRSFTLRVLRDFGLGNSRSEEIVQQECGCMLEKLDALEGRAADFTGVISIHTLNIISKFLMNKRFESGDKKIQLIKETLEKLVSLKNPAQLLILMFPFLDSSTVLSKLLIWILDERKTAEAVHDVFVEEIKEHRKHLAEKSEGEDLMDRFLMEQQNEKVPSPAFKDWQLVRMSAEILVAGYETTSTTLTWAMMLLSWHPEAQEQMFQEIRDQVGLNRRVSMADKKNLHYCQAVLDEVGRLHSVAPLAIFHRTLRDTVVGGRFFVPANTFVVPNIFGCHRDPAVWEQPHNFYPDHFLHRPGKQQQRQYRAREELVMFGMGRRQCLGESLARTELLVFLTALIQRYRVEFATSISRQQYEESMRGQNTIIRYSNIRDFCFHRRLT